MNVLKFVATKCPAFRGWARNFRRQSFEFLFVFPLRLLFFLLLFFRTNRWCRCAWLIKMLNRNSRSDLISTYVADEESDSSSSSLLDDDNPFDFLEPFNFLPPDNFSFNFSLSFLVNESLLRDDFGSWESLAILFIGGCSTKYVSDWNDECN
jgi:hypothetical protein